MKDFSIMKERSNVTDRLMSQHLHDNEMTHIFIRLLAYMETVGKHPDRQEFWEYIEKIVDEKTNRQMSLQTPENQVVTQTHKSALSSEMKSILDTI